MRRAALLVPAFLLLQAGLTQWAAASEKPPAIRDLSHFPSAFAAWSLLREEPLAAEVAATLQADQVVSRTYWRGPGRTPVNLLTAWFQTQSKGDRQPHSPQVCLPGSGWTPILTDQIQIATQGSIIPANRYVVVNNGQKAVVVYWYQSSQRAVASEWSSKFWTVWDALTVRRTDLALVRVTTWANGDDIGTATADGVEFARDLYPRLREALP